MFTRQPISLASGVLPGFSPPVVAEAALRAGFDATGIWVEPSTWTDATTRAVQDTLAGSIPVLDVEVIWLKPGPDNPDHFRVLDIGMELRAANALVVSSDPDPHASAAKLHRLCAHAAGSPLRVALEFGLFTEVRTIDSALAILEECDHPASALLIDPLHLSRSGGSPDDVRRVDRRLLSYAQFCDAPPEMPARDDVQAIIHEAVDLRLNPGDGSLPLTALLDAMPAQIPLSIELRSKKLRDDFPEPIIRAQALQRATRTFLQKARG